MSALYGRMTADGKGAVTRAPHRSLVVKAETWQGIISVELNKGGAFEITMTDKHGNDRQTIATGNLDTREVTR